MKLNKKLMMERKSRGCLFISAHENFHVKNRLKLKLKRALRFLVVSDSLISSIFRNKPVIHNHIEKDECDLNYLK
jgi:hypothetical protein